MTYIRQMCVFAATLFVLLLNVLWMPTPAYAASSLVVSSAVQTNITCNGRATGSATVSVSTGTGPYTYSWSPSGGTAATATGLAAGAYTATVTDAVGAQGTAQFTITEPTVLKTSLAHTNVSSNGEKNGSAMVSASGGTPGYAYSWAPSGGTEAIASGLAAGTYTVTVTDANTCSATQSLTITEPPPAAPTAGPVSATVAYGSSANSISLRLSGGVPTSVAVTTAPAHGTASVSDTRITYTPDTGYSGADSFSYTATNGSGTSAPATVTITVSRPTITIASGTLPNPTVGTAYSQTITANGGIAPYSYVITVGDLPFGMSLNSAGVLSGTPTASGTFNFTVHVMDGSTGNGPYSGTRVYSLTVSPPTINITPPVMPAITAGVAFSQTITASGGTGPYTYVITGGSTPTGLSLAAATGILSGTPTAAGPYSFTVTATDSSLGPDSSYTGSNSYSGTVAPSTTSVIYGVTPSSGPSSGGTSVIITGTGFSGATSVTFGATAAASFTVNSATQITATSPAGSGTVDIRVTTAGGTSATSAADQFTYLAAQQTQTITFTNPGPQNFGTTPTLTATSSSTLSPTFTSSTTGVCTITSSGVLTFVTAGSCTINADQAGNAAYQVATTVSQTFTVNAVVPGAPTVGVATAGNALASVTFMAPASTGGAAITGYTVTASPGGLTSTGASSPITVTGLTYGTDYTFKVKATNVAGTGSESAASNTVTAGGVAPNLPAMVPLALLSAVAGQAFPVTTLSATGGTAPYTFSLAPGSALPVGMALSSTGVLSGAPITAGSYNFSVQAEDSVASTSLPHPYSLNIILAAAPDKNVSVDAGATAVVDLTTGVAGGPFSAATALAVSPVAAGVASIVSSGGTHSLHFVPAVGFAGAATVQYMLQGLAPTLPGTVTISVRAARADVSQDAEVTGLVAAQSSAAQRFAMAQTSNFSQRLETLHTNGWGQSSFGLSLATDDSRRMANSGNGVADQVISGNPLSKGMRSVGLKAKRIAPAQPVASDLPDLPGAAAEQARSPWAFWVNGAISYGRERTGDTDERYRFTTNGISAGVDYRVSSWITVGTGLGISSDRSRVGTKGTRSNADSTVAVAYASMRPMQGVFVDALLGYGLLSFDSQRYITATGDMATGSRDGKQLFGSIATGLEFYRTDWMWSPYARLEFSQSKLDAYTEDGPAAYALKYFDQTARSHKAVLGARAEGKVAVRWGHIMPQVRVEYARSFDEQNEAGLAYADLADQGPAYTLRGRAMDTGRWTVGLGGRLLLRSGVELGVEYTTNIDQSSAYVGSLRLGLRVPF